MKTLSSIFQVIGGGFEEIEVWTPEAIKAFRLTLNRFLWISIFWFVLALAASAIPYVGKYIVYTSYVGYSICMLLLVRMRATWHAAGLVAGASMVTEASKGIWDVFQRIEHIGVKDGKPELRMTPATPSTGSEKAKEWTLLGRTGEWLFTAFACESIATAYLLIFSAWDYPWLFLTSLPAGIWWVIFAKKYDLDWKDYFGKFAGWYWVGINVYMLVAKNELHPLPGPIAILAGILLTLATNQHWYKTPGARRLILGVFTFALLLAVVTPYVYPLNSVLLSIRNDSRLNGLAVQRFTKVQEAAEKQIKETEDQLGVLQVKAVDQGGSLDATDQATADKLEARIKKQKEYLQSKNPVRLEQTGLTSSLNFKDERQRLAAGGGLIFLALCAMIIAGRHGK